MSGTVAPAAVAERDTEGRSDPVGAVIALLGAVLVFVGSFLPVHKLGIIPMPNNSFVSDGDWWVLIAALVMLVAGLYQLLGARTVGEWRIIIPSAGAVIAGIIGLTHHYQTLALSAAGQQLLGVSSVRATVGVGVYLVLAGGAVGLIGALLLRGWWRPAGPAPFTAAAPAATKQCPDCAETILADAHVCKHCGYRLDPPVTDMPPSVPSPQ